MANASSKKGGVGLRIPLWIFFRLSIDSVCDYCNHGYIYRWIESPSSQMIDHLCLEIVKDGDYLLEERTRFQNRRALLCFLSV